MQGLARRREAGEPNMPDRRLPASIGCIGVAAALTMAAPLAARADSLVANGTELELTMADGHILRSLDLVGATLTFAAEGSQTEVTIASVEEDRAAIGGTVFLHHFTTKDETGAVVDLCTPDAQGRSLGFPLPDGQGGFSLVCTSGAMGKCVRWGYRPWEERPGGPPLVALHQACVRMARADYGGDGRASTREGMLIYWCDRFGIHSCGETFPSPFEAAWGREGATCVAHTRVTENISLAQLAERYPRLGHHLGPEFCDRDRAARDPDALLFNHSGQP